VMLYAGKCPEEPKTAFQNVWPLNLRGGGGL